MENKNSQNRLWLSPPHLNGSELNYIQDAIHKNWVTTAGDNIAEFEKSLQNYTNAKYAVALNSGTAAIHLGLILLGVKEGDEVICPALTFAATANPIIYLKASPVFIDSEEQTWNINPVLLKNFIIERLKINKKPKAIIVVHLYGQPALMNEIIAISKEFEIPILEDAAEALGSYFYYNSNKIMAGAGSEIGILSFNGNKIITTSGGGALLTNDKKLAEKALYLATQARDPLPYYNHQEIGYNYRMSNISAGIGCGQMENIENKVLIKRNIFEFYKNEFSKYSFIKFQPEPHGTYSNHWLSTILIEKNSGITPEILRLELEKKNIESRRLWKPLHLQPVFNDCRYYGENNVAENLFETGLCLPSGTQLNETDLQRISEIIKKFIQKNLIS